MFWAVRVSLCDIKLPLMTSPRNSADAEGTNKRAWVRVQIQHNNIGKSLLVAHQRLAFLCEIQGAPSTASTLCTQGALLDGGRVARQPVRQRSAKPFLIESHALFSILLPDSALWSIQGGPNSYNTTCLA